MTRNQDLAKKELMKIIRSNNGTQVRIQNNINYTNQHFMFHRN